MKKEIRNYKLMCFIIIAYILFSCNNERIGIVTTNSITNDLQNNLKLSSFTNKNISENLEINWSDLKKTEKMGVEIYQIDAVEKNKSVIQSKLLQQSLRYQLIAIKDNNKTKSYFIEAFSNSKS